MPRPVKWRRVRALPVFELFKPAAAPLLNLEQIDLKVEELEAMRLKDREGLNQAQCAEQMGVSRQTFQLILDQARRKTVEALVEGKAIRIEGGHYTQHICSYQCSQCGHVYEAAYEQVIHICPECGSMSVSCERRNPFCEKQCQKRHHPE